jgi:hypothetical protein
VPGQSTRVREPHPPGQGTAAQAGHVREDTPWRHRRRGRPRRAPGSRARQAAATREAGPPGQGRWEAASGRPPLPGKHARREAASGRQPPEQDHAGCAASSTQIHTHTAGAVRSRTGRTHEAASTTPVTEGKDKASSQTLTVCVSFPFFYSHSGRQGEMDGLLAYYEPV